MRCFSCGKPIAHLWEDFKKKVDEGQNPNEAMKELGLERYCCKSVFIGQEDLIEKVADFKKA